jgi:SAM-dependent methyltransferase
MKRTVTTDTGERIVRPPGAERPATSAAVRTGPTDRQPPSPAFIFRTLNAHQETAALKAAIELDLFTALGRGAGTIADLARQCSAAERGMRILCDYLTVNGFLAKENDRYGLTPVSAEFLDRQSPKCLASMAEFLGRPEATSAFKDVAALVRKGGTNLAEDALAPDHPMWVTFARSMAPLMALPAQLIARQLRADGRPVRKVLDVAAGHGLFGIALAQNNAGAEIVAVDWPSVLDVARQNAHRAGVSQRYRTLPGSALDVDLGEGYDVALLTNFLHHFDPATCERLLRRVHATLAPNGRAVALEFVPNEDRVSPAVAATFSLIMLGMTAGGEAYTFSEYQGMFSRAGFSRSELRELPPTDERLIIAGK